MTDILFRHYCVYLSPGTVILLKIARAPKNTIPMPMTIAINLAVSFTSRFICAFDPVMAFFLPQFTQFHDVYPRLQLSQKIPAQPLEDEDAATHSSS